MESLHAMCIPQMAFASSVAGIEYTILYTIARIVDNILPATTQNPS